MDLLQPRRLGAKRRLVGSSNRGTDEKGKRLKLEKIQTFFGLLEALSVFFD